MEIDKAPTTALEHLMNEEGEKGMVGLPVSEQQQQQQQQQQQDEGRHQQRDEEGKEEEERGMEEMREKAAAPAMQGGGSGEGGGGVGGQEEVEEGVNDGEGDMEAKKAEQAGVCEEMDCQLPMSGEQLKEMMETGRIANKVSAASLPLLVEAKRKEEEEEEESAEKRLQREEKAWREQEEYRVRMKIENDRHRMSDSN
eukprot:evm.model.NODE_5555_length_12449_cov_31.447346.4